MAPTMPSFQTTWLAISRKQDPAYLHTEATSARRLGAFHAFKDGVPFIHGEDWADEVVTNPQSDGALRWWFFGLGSTELVSKGVKNMGYPGYPTLDVALEVNGSMAISKLGGGNSNIFYFHPYLGKISNLTNIFEMGGSTTN